MASPRECTGPASPFSALRGLAAIAILAAPESAHKRAHAGHNNWIGCVRSLARGVWPASRALLFDIVVFKEGMRGRRSPECRHRVVSLYGFLQDAYPKCVSTFTRLCEELDRSVRATGVSAPSGPFGSGQPKSLILAQNERWRQA